MDLQDPAVQINYAALAEHCSRDQFVGSSPHPFLLSLGSFEGMPRPAPTMRFDNAEALQQAVRTEHRRVLTTDGNTVLPIKKVQSTFPSMITLGRARNNDIVVPHSLVSKLHAYFSVVDGEFYLADAGSSNGTRIGNLALLPRGAPERVRTGDRVSFGVLSFLFLDAAGLWAALHQPNAAHP